MSFNLGTAEGHIKMDYDGRGAKAAKDDMDDLQSKSARGQQALQSAGNVMGAAGLAIAGGLALAVNSAADFEQRMSAIEAVSGATGDQMDAISDKALQLGADTAFSAGEAASAIEELIKAGLTVDEVLNGAADATVNLAAAGEIDLKRAATIASNAMNQFGLDAKDMPHVADLIAGAANRSAIDVADFGESIEQAGAVANLAGVDFDDTATAIAIMGNAGIKGSDAGTSLKTMLTNLIPQTEKQAGLMEDLGIITEDAGNRFFDAQGNLKDLDDVIGILSDSLKGMTREDRMKALTDLFGSDAVRAAATLAQEGAKGFRGMAKAMGKISAEDTAEKRLDNLKGSWEALMGSLETSGIMIGQIFLDPLKQVVDGVNELVGAFTDLDKDTQKAIGWAAAAVGAFLLVGSGAIKLYGFIQGIAGIIGALTAGPVVLIILAILALAAGFVIAYKKSEAFRDFINNKVVPVLQDIKDKALEVVDWFRQNWPNILQFFKDVWEEIGPTVKQGFETVKTFVEFYLEWLKFQFKVVTGFILKVWNKWGDDLWRILKPILKFIVGGIKNALRIIQGVFQVFEGLIKGDWGLMWKGIKNIVGGAKDQIVNIVKTLGSVLKAIFTSLWDAAKDIAQKGADGIVAAVKALPGKLMALVHLFVSAGKAIVQGLVDGFKSVTGFAGDVAAGIWDVLKGLINSAIDSINSALEFSIDTPGPGSVGVNPPDIPHLARGAIVTSPTLAIVGEGRDDEWVMPESRLGDFFAEWAKDGIKVQRGEGKDGPVITIVNPEPERGSDSLVLALNQLTVAGVL